MSETMQTTQPGHLDGELKSFVPGVVERLLRDSAYCLTSLPFAVGAFMITVVGVSAGAALLVTVVGLPVLAGTGVAVRGLAHLERSRVRTVLHRPVPTPVYAARRDAGPVRRSLAVVADPQTWLDLLWGAFGLVTALLAFTVALTWWALALGGVTNWLWQGFIPSSPDNVTLAELIGLGSGRGPEMALNAAIGLVALATLPVVLRGAALAHASLGAVLLSSRAEIQRELARATAGRQAARAAEADSFRRLERDIHDGPQQRLVRLSMDLGRARRQLEQDPDAARATIDAALAQARETVEELRSLSRGIAPPVLVDRGLVAALDELVTRSAVPVTTDVRLPVPLPPHVETAVYFVVSEALTNVAKHAAATTAHVAVTGDDRTVRVLVRDDGRGGAHLSKGHGLAGLEQRVRAADGVLTVTSPAGGPTTIEAEVPCGS